MIVLVLLYYSVLVLLVIPGLCKMYPRVGLRAAVQHAGLYNTRMFVISKIHHALHKGNCVNEQCDKFTNQLN